MKKKILLTALMCMALLASTVLSGCAPAGAVVAKVGDEVITTVDLKMYANFVLLNYNMTLADLEDPEQIKMIYEQALDVAVMLKTTMKKGIEKKMYPLSAADRKIIDTNVNTYLDEQLKTLKEGFTQQAANNPAIDPDREARKALDANMKSTGLTRDNMILLMKYLKVMQLQQDEVTKNITVTDADLKAGYDEKVAEQKEVFVDSEAFENAKNAESQGGPAVLYRPEGYRYVKHILISLPQDIITKISEARTSGDEAAANKLRDDELLKIKAKADEVLAKVNTGEDFDSLMAQYGEDPGMKEEPASKTGYELGSATGFIPEFKDAALKLGKVGDVTGLVGADYGYHIIKWVGNVPSGPLPLEDVAGTLQPEMLAEKQSDAWDKYLEQLKAEYKVVEYPELLPTATPAPTATAVG